VVKIKKILVCSAWPYAHNIPHLGNLIGCLLSGDVFARYYRIRGFDTLYVSGTDMHGTSIEVEAIKQGISPKELAEKNHKIIKKLIEEFEIKFDNYTTTETENHKEFVKEIYLQMEKNGFITTKTEKRAFCKNCQKFLADAFIVGKCPKCDYGYAKGNQCEKCGAFLEAEELIEPICKICEKSKIIFKKTKHWYIDLKKLQSEIAKYVKSHPEWSTNVKHFTVNWLKEGLKPRAVTRDIVWGIDAPFKGASGKKIYVWAEAALGYISATKEINKNWKDFWFGEDVKQIYTLAKDNIPFHTLLFPAQLLASEQDYHLPDQIAATEYLNWEGGQKFSKTRKVGIFMDDALELLPATYWRFYLLYNRPEGKDIEFSWIEFDKAVNKVLIGDYVNFVNRVTTLADKYFDGKIDNLNLKLDKEDNEVLNGIKNAEKKISETIEKGFLSGALKEIMALAKIGNIYLQKREPWKQENKRKETLYVCSNLVKAISILSYPFIPSVSEKVWNLFGIKNMKWKDALKTQGFICKKPKNILSKINVDELKDKIEKRTKVTKGEILFKKIETDIKLVQPKVENKQGGDKMITIEDFGKVELKIATILEAEAIEGSDKLVKLQIDVGEKKQIVAGIRTIYSPEDLVGKQIVVVNNLQPTKLKGVDSNGMLLAANDNGPVLLTVDKPVKNGSKVS